MDAVTTLFRACLAATVPPETMLSVTLFPFIHFTSTDPISALVYPWKAAGSSTAFLIGKLKDDRICFRT
jgi:hypothetical protein